MTWITGGDAHKCAKINSPLPFPFNCLSLSIKTKGTEQTTPRDYIFQSSSSLKSRTTTGKNKCSCLNGKKNTFYNHSEIFLISLNASELACSTSIFYLLLNKVILLLGPAWTLFRLYMNVSCWGVRTTSRTTHSWAKKRIRFRIAVLFQTVFLQMCTKTLCGNIKKNAVIKRQPLVIRCTAVERVGLSAFSIFKFLRMIFIVLQMLWKGWLSHIGRMFRCFYLTHSFFHFSKIPKTDQA